VLLIANYALDRQQSMLRSAGLFRSGLVSAGINVAMISPRPLFGRFSRSAQVRKWLGYIDKYVLFPFSLISKARRYEVVHIVDHSNALYCFFLGRRKVIVTCNDLLAIRSGFGEFPENPTSLTGRFLQKWILAGLKRAGLIVAISEATLADVRRIVGISPDRCRRIYLPLGERFADALRGPRSRSESNAYILHVGGDVWYKNRRGVLLVHELLRNRMGDAAPRLVMVGPGIDQAGTRVEFVQDVSDHQMVDLYRNAAVLLFPSIAEGFGWPVVEAMACGCPVITTGKPPLTEAGGEAAIYISNPEDTHAIVEKLDWLLNLSPVARSALITKGFTQARRFLETSTIDQYLALYAESRVR
jgi:glycosyltransferase involved in cell wall biosynthesis